MPVSAALTFLDARDADVPAALREATRAAASEAADADVVQALLAAARNSLAATLSKGEGRAAALDLLAADALLTWACEAAAESGVSVEILSERAARELASLLHDTDA